MKYIFTWIPAYAEFVKKLSSYRNRQEDLIQVLRDIGVNVNDDEDIRDHKVPLSEIDPYTFLFFLGKPVKDWKKVQIIRSLCTKWDIKVTVHDVCGIPSPNAQRLWLFPYQYSRTNNEIKRLWDFFEKANEGKITDGDFADAITIHGIGKTKLTEALFIQNPNEYLCINSKVRPYLQARGINPEFETFSELKTLYQTVSDKFSLPFYEISFKSHIQAVHGERIPKFYRIGTKEGDNGPTRLPEMLENSIVSIGWPEIGNLYEIEPRNKKHVQKALQDQGYYLNDNRTASRKGGEIVQFIEDILPGDYVFAADGMHIRAIGKVISDHYAYDYDRLKFPHIRCVEWQKFDKTDFSLNEGLRTTIWEFKDVEILKKIRQYLGFEAATNTGSSLSSQPENTLDMPINRILYGPPGTGKTYRTIDHALSIIDGTKSVEKIAAERENDQNGVLKKTFDDLMKEGQIAFCTFHQSMGYEDFIEGIKPLPPNPDEDKPMQYAVVDGIFKKMCTEATFELASLNKDEPTDKLVDFSYLYDQFVSDIQERQSRGEVTELTTVSGGTIVVDSISDRNNLIVKHKGSVKPYIVSKDRLSRLANGVPDLKAISNVDVKFREVIGGSNATAYWAALNAIRQLKPVESRSVRDLLKISYEDKKRAIEHFNLEKYDAEQAKRFVLIIDEINRGNVAQIFGELITLIEDDKRMGAKMVLKATLPYSNESFAVPPNLYIIGTMNTADRSVEALDTALRRRFTFVHMKPEPGKLGSIQGGIDLNKMLTHINKRLEILLDADHTIGHAWLWDVHDLAGLRLAFKDKILPLLQEFFYNDYEKIGLVLGDAFVSSEEVKPKEVFAAFKSDLPEEYATAKLFHLKDVMEITMEQFSAI